MIRALVFALTVALMIQSRGPNASEAAEYQLYVDQECSAHGVIAFFTWSGASPAATEQWLDLSLFNNEWQPGSFLGGGPMAATTTAHTWDGLIPNTVHYVRLNQKLSDGAWDPSATYYFQTLDCAGGTPSAGASDTPAAPRALLDMVGRHDGSPLGVPSNFDWQGGPTIHLSTPPAGWDAMLGWGQVYSDVSQPTPPANLRIHVSGLTIYGLAEGSWQVLQSVQLVGGSYYTPSYNGGAIPATERHEADGGVSVAPYAGRPYHFFPSARVPIPSGLTGVVVAVRARLILNDPAGADSRPEARIMLGAGLDWFGGLAGNTKTRGACVGPMVWLTSEYQTFTCHTFRDPGVLQANPPPLP